MSHFVSNALRQVGAYMFDIVAAELAFVFLFLGIVVLTWPSPPPFSKPLFLACDLLFRPPAPDDLARTAGDLPRPQ